MKRGEALHPIQGLPSFANFGAAFDEVLQEVGEADVHYAFLSPTLWHAVAMERWKTFHAVALTARTPSKLMAGVSWTRAEKTKLHEGCTPLPLCRQRPLPMRRAAYVLAHNAAPAEIILDWLFATRHLKNPADGEAAKADWARVFAPTAEGRSELVHHSTYVAKETPRLARIRLDCVNNLLMRAMFAATCVDQLALFLFLRWGPSVARQ